MESDSGSSSTINEERSNDICNVLNKKYPNILVALVVAKNATPTQVTARKISTNTLTISYVECQGTMCTLNSVDISFNPPIKSANDAIDRIVRDGKRAMEAQCAWLVTEPLPLLILIVTSVLGYATLGLGEDGLQSAIDSVSLVGQIISTIFGSYFFIVVRASFYFAVVAHAAEAIYIAIMLRTRATLGYLACLKWFALISCVGYPMTKKALMFTNQPIEDKLD
jgi:hypothetical protein